MPTVRPIIIPQIVTETQRYIKERRKAKRNPTITIVSLVLGRERQHKTGSLGRDKLGPNLLVCAAHPPLQMSDVGLIILVT